MQTDSSSYETWAALREKVLKGAVIIYGWGGGANLKIACTQNLTPPLDNRTLRFCPPP